MAEDPAYTSEQRTVKLWCCDSNKRKVSDATDLDVIFTSLEDELWQLRGEQGDVQGRRAVNKLYKLIQEEVFPAISAVRKTNEAKRSLNACKRSNRRLQENVISQQQRNMRLRKEIADLRKSDGWLETLPSDTIRFLADLRSLQQRCLSTADGATRRRTPSKTRSGATPATGGSTRPRT